MAEPIFTAKTERVWARLPERVRLDDADNGWAFKTFLSTLTDRTDSVSLLLERFTYLPPWSPLRRGGAVAAGKYATSDLIDPATADPAWLGWLAQIPGVTLTPAMSTQAKRDAIDGAVNGWAAGTRPSIADAARTALLGGRYVRVLPHSITTDGDGGRWDILLVTRISETPDVPAVLAAVVAARAVPAGAILHHIRYSATFVQTRAALPTDTLAARKTRFPTFLDATDFLP